MKLEFIEVSGFRGFREKVRINFGTGFTVISGRNGVGKSTVCDAIEFVLLGSVNKFKFEKAAGESMSDYIWWRGEGTPEAHYVTVGFTGDNGERFSVTRTRETGSDKEREEIEDALCSGPRPDDVLRQMCKTTIIRDEWIADLSIDLSEIERFEFVRSALGPTEGSELAERAKAVLTSAQVIHSRNTKEYEAAHARLADTLAQLSEARDAVSRVGDIAAAIELVTAEVRESSSDIISHLATGRAELASRRVKLSQANEAVRNARETAALREAFHTPESQQRREAVRLALANAAKNKAEAERLIDEANTRLVREERVDALATSLAALVETGERLGLHEGNCPLCGAMRSPEEFESGILLAQERIKSLSSGVASARHSLATARKNAERPFSDYASAEQEWTLLEREESHLVAKEESNIAQVVQAGLSSNSAQDPDALDLELATERDRLIELERALLTLEASQVVSTTATLEDRVGTLRNEVEVAADAMEQSQAAISSSRAIDHALKRVSAEIIDERLAQISPLLNELYQRLRPHAEWRAIDYRLRGDVRKFLSLRVGDGLNPQFVLSSGQRRAVGLAFLLSVHFARSWTSWRTLVLDDPVQHIDDFRALHFVEILAAASLDGRQIVCTIEDSALADLLCRRLVSIDGNTGRRYDIDLDSNGLPSVISEAEFPPLAARILDRNLSA